MTIRPQEHDREAALLAELQHRVRNTIATTRMIARRSAETSESLEDYVAHLDGRLAALARIQNAAIRNPTEGIDLGLLVADELTSIGQGSGSQVTVKGPIILLHPRAAEPFALALHELSTNAIKFGAFASPRGHLNATWQVKPDADVSGQHLFFDWIETGVELDDHGERRAGFGTLVLNELLKHNLGAKIDLWFAPTGLQCRICIPLGERVIACRSGRKDG